MKYTKRVIFRATWRAWSRTWAAIGDVSLERDNAQAEKCVRYWWTSSFWICYPEVNNVCRMADRGVPVSKVNASSPSAVAQRTFRGWGRGSNRDSRRGFLYFLIINTFYCCCYYLVVVHLRQFQWKPTGEVSFADLAPLDCEPAAKQTVWQKQ